MKSALHEFVEPIRNRGFVALWLGQSFALSAAELHLLALVWFAYTMSGSGLILGTVLVAGMAPRIVFALLGGVAADRVSYRAILGWCNGLRAGLLIGLALMAMANTLEIWHLYIFAAVLGTITSFYMPAYYAAIPKIVDRQHLRPGNAVLRGTAEIIGLIGPAAAGLVVVQAGSSTAFTAAAVGYAVATLVLIIGSPPVVGHLDDKKARPGVVEALREGVTTVAHHSFLRRLVLVIGISNLALAGPIAVGFPFLASERFAGEAFAYGLLMSMWTAGALVGALLVGVLRRLPSWRVVSAVVTGVLGGSLWGLGLSPTVAVAATFILLMGLAAGSFNVLFFARLQEDTEPAMMGRVMSFAELSEVLLTPVSYLTAGLLLDIAPLAVFGGAGALLLVASLLLATSTTSVKVKQNTR